MSSRARAEKTNVATIAASLGGRGKGALFGLDEDLPRLLEIDLGKIRLNPDQPRKVFDQQALADLAGSIERHGLIQPIVVKRIPREDAFLLVAGERRLRAVQALGRPAIKAVITDGQPDEIALIENLQRTDLKPIEQAQALDRLMQTHNYTQMHVADLLGIARSSVSDLVQLIKLPDDIKRECLSADIPKSILIEIARLKDPNAQRTLWRKVKEGGTVRTVRESKATGEAKTAQAQTPATKVIAAARRFVNRLQEVSPDDLALNRDQYHELLRLKEQIDQLVQLKARFEAS